MSGLVEASSVTVKTMADGTLRLSVDIEPRFARVAFGLFGSPGTPMALDALKTAVQAEEQPQQKPAGPLCKWVSIRCREPQFVEFLRPVYDRIMGGNGSSWGDVSPSRDFGGKTENWAAHAVKLICNVDSRKKIDGNKEAETLLNTLIREPYAEWLAARGGK